MPYLLYMSQASFSDMDCFLVEKTGKLHRKYQSAPWTLQVKLILKGSITESEALESVRDSKHKQFGT